MQQKWNQNFDGEPMTDIPQKFLSAGCDVYMVMQLRHDEKIFDERFASMLYIFGCGLYTLYCREWLQFLILLVAEFACFVLIFMGALIADAAERFSGWVAGL